MSIAARCRRTVRVGPGCPILVRRHGPTFLIEGLTMTGVESHYPAERLLASIRAAGYTSIDEFIHVLRVDPCADTVEIPAVQGFWIIPERRAS